MSSKILLQLDPDAHPSVFDSVVAVDAGIDQLFRHSNVEASQVRDQVYGCIFTRGGDDLKNTAIFIGGTQVAPAEELLQQAQKAFFGPMRVSLMFDANGCNTTASAAVIAASRHVSLNGATALILAGTGPVGLRVARLLAKSGAKVKLASRQLDRAEKACAELTKRYPEASFTPVAPTSDHELCALIGDVTVIVAAGAPGVQLISATTLAMSKTLKVAIDLNAVPPVGIEGIKPTDKAVEQNGVIRYGALGVGGTKMKIHKAALQKLFTANDLVLDAEEIFEIGMTLEKK